MTTVKNVLRKIARVEKFDVKFKHPSGRDINDNKDNVPTYKYSNMARDAITVSTWKAQRFRPNYPGFNIDVLNGDRSPVAGNTLLSSVRASYP